MTTREITNAQTKANFEKRCGERDRGGNPQHFLVKAAEVQCRGARERVPASKFSPSVEKKNLGVVLILRILRKTIQLPSLIPRKRQMPQNV